jgi:DNA-binding NarL/FixJ family response regulator
MGKIKILLADDHQVVRQGMRALLNAQPDLEVIGEAADGHELVQMVWKMHPEVVVSDIAMPNLNGIEATVQIHKRFPDVKVVILSMHSASPYVIRALRGGALGYLLKDDDIRDVIQAIRTVAQGARFLSAQVSELVIDALLSGKDATLDLEERITEREREILQMVAEGNTNTQIAEKLNISPRTVEKHRANLMSKLSLTSQADIVRFAIQQGIVSLKE